MKKDDHMKRKVICYVISSLANEGPVNVMYNIIKHIDRLYYDVFIITLIREKENSRIKEIKNEDLKIIQIEASGLLKPIVLFKKLYDEIEKIQPDVIHAHCPRSLFLMYFLSHKWKKAYTIHNYPGLLQRILYGNTFGFIVTQLSKYFIKKIDWPIACAENIGDEFKIKDNFKVIVIPNGAEVTDIDLNEQKKKSKKAELGLDETKTYLLFIGRFSKEKNPEFLISCFESISQDNIGLIMLGDGPMYERLSSGNLDKRIVMPGFVNNVSEYIIASEYYISTSESEGLANTLLETMAFGLPFILSDIPSHSSVVSKSSNIMGVTFQLNNEEDFISKVEGLLSYKREEVSDNVKTCFKSHFTAQRMSAEYQVLYNDN